MVLAAVVALQLAACGTPAMIAMALIPDGTLSIMMSHFERESKVNRDQLAALEKKGDWPGIANFAEDNIAKDKLNAVWWMVAGHAYSRQGRHPRAIERYQEVVRLEPEVAEGYTLLAQEYRSSENRAVRWCCSPTRSMRCVNQREWRSCWPRVTPTSVRMNRRPRLINKRYNCTVSLTRHGQVSR